MQPVNNTNVHLPSAIYLKKMADLPSHLNIERNGFVQGLAVKWIERPIKARAPFPLPHGVATGIQLSKLDWTEECNLFLAFEVADLLAIYRREIPPPMKVNNTSELHTLMNLPSQYWEIRGVSHLNEKIKRYHSDIIGEKNNAIGFYEKYCWQPGSHIAAIGDIHGEDIRLMSTINSLVELGYLDANYRCLPNKYLIFLGDYVDRGNNSLKVLELLITLKLENPQQVHLIRGNHEDLNTTLPQIEEYTKLDPKYREYLESPLHMQLLSLFFNSLPLAVYVCQQTVNPTREYIQFCHGLFHLYTDPAPFLESAATRYWLENSTTFSKRVCDLMRNWEAMTDDSIKAKRQRNATRRLMHLSTNLRIDTTNLYWLDIGNKFSIDPRTYRTRIPSKTIKAYLQACSTDTNKVKEIVRGHQGSVFTTQAYDKVVATTIDPSKNPKEQVYIEIRLHEKIHQCGKDFISYSLEQISTLP